MNKILFAATFIGTLLFLGCSEYQKKKEPKKEWKFIKELQLQDISPIGIVAQNNFLWLSDVDNNRVVKINIEGKMIEEYSGFERPMHIALYNGALYIPEYTSDTIQILKNGNTSAFKLKEQPDAIGGIAFDSSTIAVADFNNHRIILQQGESAVTFGKEGHGEGELYYPTDVAFFAGKIYVADAYNNRIQVFDKQGNSLQIIGDKDGINVATGLEVANNQLFVTDFEGNRVLVYDLKGNLLQTFSENLHKPTDIAIIENIMYAVNYEGQSVAVYQFQ